MKKNYPRNMIGFGSKTPIIKWPNDAKLALQIVLNYEEGSENCVLHGDKSSETFLSEIVGAQPIKVGILIWNPFMNLDQEEVFGGFMNFSKKEKFQ
jgi:hypothetical protein